MLDVGQLRPPLRTAQALPLSRRASSRAHPWSKQDDLAVSERCSDPAMSLGVAHQAPPHCAMARKDEAS
eukprot:9437298-Alexandrium_andersonii.AAC.1